MKIAVFHNLPSGGAKRILLGQVGYLSQNHTVDVFFTQFSRGRDFLDHKNTKIREHSFDSSWPKNFVDYLHLVYYRLPCMHREIAKKIDRVHYDVVLAAHDFWTKSPYLLRYLRTPSVYWCHEPPREFYEPLSLHNKNIKEYIAWFFRIPIKKIDTENVNYASTVITGSKFMQKKLFSIYKRKIFLVKNGVDTKFFRYKRVRRERFFLSVGALTRLKGYDFLIRSIARSKLGKKLPLVLVGNGGQDEEEFLMLARRMGVKVITKKFIKDIELLSLYNRALLLLYAPINEPFGLVPLEAMACGLPVLAVDEGGIKETVKQKVGWTTKRCEDDFAEKLDRLLKNPLLIEAQRPKVRTYVEKHWSNKETCRQLLRQLLNTAQKR